MRSKDIRNLILTLIILAVGIKLILLISAHYIAQAGAFSELATAFQGLGDLTIYGLAAIVLLLLPYYFSKRSM